MGNSDFARDENFGAVEALLLGHPEILSIHRLQILSCIPESCDPHRYRHLLPRLHSHPQSQSPLYDDWVDTPAVFKRIHYLHSHDSPLRKVRLHVKPCYMNVPFTMGALKNRRSQRQRYLSTGAECFTDAAVTRWYLERMRAMDQYCGIFLEWNPLKEC